MDREKNEKWQACSNNKKKGKYHEFTHRISGAFTNNRHEEKKGKKKATCEAAETPLDELNLLELGLRFPFVGELFKTRRLEEREGMEAEVNAWVESSSTTLCLIKDEALRLRGLNILDNMVR